MTTPEEIRSSCLWAFEFDTKSKHLTITPMRDNKLIIRNPVELAVLINSLVEQLVSWHEPEAHLADGAIPLDLPSSPAKYALWRRVADVIRQCPFFGRR